MVICTLNSSQIVHSTYIRTLAAGAVLCAGKIRLYSKRICASSVLKVSVPCSPSKNISTIEELFNMYIVSYLKKRQISYQFYQLYTYIIQKLELKIWGDWKVISIIVLFEKKNHIVINCIVTVLLYDAKPIYITGYVADQFKEVCVKLEAFSIRIVPIIQISHGGYPTDITSKDSVRVYFFGPNLGQSYLVRFLILRKQGFSPIVYLMVPSRKVVY